MQRINWFPDPNITQAFATYAPSTVKVDFPFVNGRNWVRATVLTVGDTYVQYSLKGDRLPPAGTYHVHFRAFAQHANAYVRVYTRVGDNYEMQLENEITDGTTVDVDGTITVPGGCEEIIIRIQTGNVVGAIGMMSDILIERADTYDTAVGGGASGLLHRGHDATRLRRSVGRVMSDDGHEHLSDTAYGGYAQTRTQRYGFLQYADSGKRLLCEFLGHVFRPRLRENILWQRDHVHAGRAVCQPVLSIDKHDENSNGSRVWLSNSPSDRLRGLRELRVHETSVGLPGHITLQRGYDATRLTLLGVMA